MKITFHPATGSDVVLCDGPTRDLDKIGGPFNVRFPIRAAVQPNPAIRADYAGAIGRGNCSVGLAFECFYRDASEEDCVTWLATYLATLQFNGTHSIYLDYGPNNATRRTLANAAIESVDAKVDGATVRLSFVIQGGAYT